jgi:hypothetical protein
MGGYAYRDLVRILREAVVGLVYCYRVGTLRVDAYTVARTSISLL